MSDPVIPLLNHKNGTLTCRRGDPDPDKVTLVVSFSAGGPTQHATFAFEQLNLLAAHGYKTHGQGGSASRDKRHTAHGDVVELKFDGSGATKALVSARRFANAAFVFI